MATDTNESTTAEALACLFGRVSSVDQIPMLAEYVRQMPVDSDFDEIGQAWSAMLERVGSISDDNYGVLEALARKKCNEEARSRRGFGGFSREEIWR